MLLYAVYFCAAAAECFYNNKYECVYKTFFISFFSSGKRSQSKHDNNNNYNICNDVTRISKVVESRCIRVAYVSIIFYNVIIDFYLYTFTNTVYLLFCVSLV